MLPSRPVPDGTEAVARDAMYRALDGVTKYAFNEAINAVLRGKLGHTFFPSPVELRRLCDEAQRPHDDMARRARLSEEQRREREAWRAADEAKTPEARANVSSVYQRFCERYEPAPVEDTVTLDPELVAKVPDAPKTLPGSFKRAMVG